MLTPAVSQVLKICQTMTKLEVLDLSWSPKITDACLAKLNKMARLTTLNVTFTNLTRPAINTAAGTYPQVQNLYYWGLKK